MRQFVLPLLLSCGLLAAAPISLPGGASFWEKTVDDVHFAGVAFDEKTATFAVLDNAPDRRRSLADAVAQAGAVAGTNGNYFHPDYTPLGLVVSGGRTLHAFEKARLLSGLLTVADGRIALVSAARFRNDRPLSAALQAGPWLVVDGQPRAGLDTVKPARRTFVATDGRGRWALVVTGPITLAALGQALATPGLCGDWPVREALNLDGGSSTSLAVLSDGASVFAIPSFGPVANYLVIVPRHR